MDSHLSDSDCGQSTHSKKQKLAIEPSECKSSGASGSSRKKKFQEEWLSDPLFKGWLRTVPSDIFKCKCIACNVEILCGKSELLKHSKGQKHMKLVKSFVSTPSMSSFLNKPSVAEKCNNKVKEAEIKLSVFLPNIMLHFKLWIILFP